MKEDYRKEICNLDLHRKHLEFLKSNLKYKSSINKLPSLIKKCNKFIDNEILKNILK